MIEIFSVLMNSNNINNIPTADLIDLFVKGENTIYDISLVGKGNVILKNKQENKFEKLDCVCNHFDVPCNNCNDLLAQFNISHATCKECYKCCLQKLNEGELTLK